MKTLGLSVSFLITQATAQTSYSIARQIKQAGFDLLAVFLDDNDLFSAVLDHGCWCAKLDPFSDHEDLGGPQAVDDLDNLCKVWYQTCNCANIAQGVCENFEDDTLIDLTFTDVKRG